MAALLQTDAEGLNRAAADYHELYPIAARCGVFAKSDIQPLINEGATLPDLAASIFQAVVNQTISGLACGKPIRGCVAFLGGPLHFLPELKKAFIRTLHLTPENIVDPDNSHLFAAMGAALEAGDAEPADAAALAAKLRSGVQMAFELKRLPPLLAETLAEYENVTVVEGDVLKVDLAALIRDEFPGLRVAVCANLPYYITSPIVMKLLEERLPIEHITVMVQKEAADRLSAAPGTRAAGAVTYAVHYYAAPRTLFTVQPGSFYPPPKVTSAVIQLRLHEAPPVTPRSAEAMFRVIRAAFSQRRKTAANAASAGLHLPKEAVAEALAAAGVPPTARPEQLTLQNYADVSDVLFAFR